MSETLAHIKELRRAHERMSRGSDSPTGEQRAKGELPRVVVGGCLDLANAMEDLQPVLGSLFYQGQVITITAHPGHGKSTTMFHACACLTLQTAFGNMRPSRDDLVYYVSAEDVEGTRKRIFGESVVRKLDAAGRARLDSKLRWVHLRGITAPSVIREHIAADAGAADVSTVVLDTGPAMFAGDSENDNVQQQAFINECRVLTDLPGRPCVPVLWHPAKGAGADNLVPRGGSAIIGAIDGNVTLWNDADSGVATLARSPWKWRGDHFEPMHFRFDTVPLVLPSGKPASIKVAVPVDGVPASAIKPIRREVALDALHETVSELGRRMPGTSTIPPGAKVITLEQWRTRWALRTGYADSGADSVRVNFNKDKDALLKAGRIVISSPYVWVA